MADYEARLQAIEDLLVSLQETVNQLATRSEMMSHVNARQLEVTNISDKINSLKIQVQLLQSLELME